jgi:cytochrome c nitrite reductase small subunit
MKPPLLVGIITLVVAIAVGLYVTDFTAYLGNNPTTCNNCHVMDGAYEGWYHGGHKNAATCSDCHTPHALIPKYWVKAQSGYHHVTAFVFGDIPDAIRAKETSKKVVQDNCVRCHSETVANIADGQSDEQSNPERYCFACHRNVAHGERGISILPYQHSEEYK